MNNSYINEIIRCIKNTQVDTRDSDSILTCDSIQAIELLTEEFVSCKKSGNTIFFIGNGGSAAIASHMTADFLKNGGIKTCSLFDNAVCTCVGNDYGYEYVFSKPLERLIAEKDILVAISSSGSSKNILNAIAVAQKRLAKVITFTGFQQHNAVRSMGDKNVWVPSEEYGIVESIHNLLLQQIVDIIKNQS